VSEAHLHRYLNEFDFRYNYREKLGVDDASRAGYAVQNAKGRRLTYRGLVAKRKRLRSLANVVARLLARDKEAKEEDG